MKGLYVLPLLAALGLFAAAEEPFPAAEALLPHHEHPAASGPALSLDEVERIALLNNPEIRVAALTSRGWLPISPKSGFTQMSFKATLVI
jgi:hypothetical protein